MGGGAKAAVAVVGIAGLVLMGVVFWPNQAPEPPANLMSKPQPAASTSATGATVPEAVAEAPTDVAQTPAPDAAPPPRVTIDNWRVEADGAALIAGQAAADAEVAVLVDGARVAGTTATATGGFVAMFTLLPNDQPSLLTLQATLPDGTALATPEAIALGPIAGPAPAEPVATAEAPPEAASEQVGTSAPAAAEAEAPQAPPAALLVTEEGAKVVTPAPDPAQDQIVPVSIAAIAYTPDGGVQISGSGQPGQAVRLYLDNQFTVETPVQADRSWQAVLTDTLPGVYALRADQVDGSGKVTARFETPFKRETPEVLAALSEPEPAPMAPEPAANVAENAPESAPTEPLPKDAAPLAEKPAETTVAAPAEAAAPDEPIAPDVADAGAVPEPAPAAEPPVATLPQAPQPESPAQVASSPAVPSVATAPGDSPAGAEVVGANLTEPQGEKNPPPVVQTVSITVQPGYSLWRIARDTYGEGILYVQVYEANKDKIGDPDLIYPGQVFELPAQ